LLGSSNMNGHTLGFQPQKLNLSCAQKTHQRKVVLMSYYMNDHTIGFHPKPRKLTLYLVHNKHTKEKSC